MSGHFKNMSGQTHVTPHILSDPPKIVIILPGFVKRWMDFIQKTVNLKAFYQFVTQHILDYFIKLEFPVNSAVSVSDSCVCLWTVEERCALRYVAGYIIRTIYEKIELGSHPNKKEMMCFVLEFAGDGMRTCKSEEWEDMVNRRGLWAVNDQAYDVFLIIEDLIQRHFTFATNRIEGAATLQLATMTYSFSGCTG